MPEVSPALQKKDVNILSLSVVRRDGSITPFKSEKITNAIKKAFLAQTKIRNNKNLDKEQDDNIHKTVGILTNKVVSALTRRIADGDMIHIEDIQDQVELALMRAEHHKVARAYVLYREQRAASRYHTKKLKEQIGGKVSSMMVTKRDGKKEPVSLDKITNRVSVLSTGLAIDPITVAQKAIPGLFNEITSAEIDNYLAETAASLTVEHPDYSYLAARVKANALHKETPGFVIATKNLYEDGLLKQEYYNKVMENADVIESIIDYDRDYRFDYFALTTLTRAYLLRFENKTIERPQDLWMRVALTVSCDDFDYDKVKKTYFALSEGEYTHATPTLFNSGLKMQQLSSCFLIAMEDDSIEGIFNTIKDCALISKTAGGIGMHAHNIRASGSRIKSTNGKSNGLIPFLKIFNETAKSVDQGGGKRKGSFAIYLEPWHADIEKFLELRKNTGAEEFRARDLFYALWIPDLFMQRVEKDEDWTLMSEHECPGLSDTFGKEFEKLYTNYEKKIPDLEKIKARTLMSKIIEAQIETGQPYMLYKDSINEKSNQKNIGVIKSSNLCAEIVEFSGNNETAVCNLASIALPKFVNKKEKKYDYKKLYETAKLAIRNLDQVIDINFYPTNKTDNSNKLHRPVGLGVQGLADVFFMLKTPYDSEKAIDINKQIFETIYFGALESSMELAKEKGTYSTYEGSPLSEGRFQFDLWDVKPSTNWDWEGLREKIKKYGVRNSLTTACMPTASTGIILSNTETFQIQTSNIYKRQTLSGEFLLVNRHLVKELSKRNLWNKTMRDNIILENGSVQNIPDFPQDLKDTYKTVWETSQKTVIDMAADRAPFIDQTQSMNLWLSNPTFGKVNSMHMYAWKKGLKTGMYYLRSRSAVDAVKVTVSSEKKVKEEFLNKNSVDNEEECLTCSA
ncbi:MAG: Ribonucleoside-diphosphate reductase 1 subunit alpha [Alphaproteobacteria bacterium MarineAlpha5_Bin8]|nr:MAG: Ribonucleoside-diphosphate reductase 1 subunit alpha [Alphaproteobacteria bacterium MarineAlpha5_Bin8]PPR46167.1 MAG: Ribonucleoside-diphosphate reductase 1 subunit alpha [Alphaproteobacteria bacterium MarineAlpha5_Bin7]PPR54971.1 MAG: Ribonucleoside-diphosphate reductase 1 subunit alpha [Alphaproteobacteria bacterium MarineAlpha5_Bin6]|tara:strand:+ start:1557 stop:4286 length:2730 start_codon:yes stop_codon:yes gene_type:complete